MSKDNYLPLSFSSLKAFSESPRAFVHYKKGRRVTTPAMLKGTLIHRRILEPSEYLHTVEVFDGARRGAAWTDFKEANSMKDIVTRAESEVINGAYHATKEHPLAWELINGCTHYEQEVSWRIDELPFRGFIDGYNDSYALDLKTMPDISFKAVERQIWSYKYFMQAALYKRGLAERGIDMQAYYIVAVQASAPHNVAVYRFDNAYLHRGDMIARDLVKQWREWDGKPTHAPDTLNSPQVIDAPLYAPPLTLDLNRQVHGD